MSEKQQPVAWGVRHENGDITCVCQDEYQAYGNSKWDILGHLREKRLPVVALVTADYAEAIRQQRDELLADMEKIAFMPYPGAPDIEMRRIARVAIAKAKETK